MKQISVIIRKIPLHPEIYAHQPLPYINRFINLQNHLTKYAAKTPGFVNSNSFWKTNKDHKKESIAPIINISTWKNEDHWTQWYYSVERQQIIEHYKELNYSVNIDICKQRVPYIETPLL